MIATTNTTLTAKHRRYCCRLMVAVDDDDVDLVDDNECVDVALILPMFSTSSANSWFIGFACEDLCKFINVKNVSVADSIGHSPLSPLSSVG